MPLRRHAGLALLVGLVFTFCWPLANPWAPAGIVAGDFTHEFFALHAFAMSELERGRLPLWNPYTFGGHPYVAELQTAFWYPPHVVLHGLLLTLHRSLSLGALEWLLPVHLLLAAAGAYLLGRQCSGSRTGGVLTGLTYALGGYLTSYPLQQLPILEASAWLPWQAYCLLRLAKAVRSKGHMRRWLALLAVASGWSALAGHPQTLLYALTVLVPMALLLAWRIWRTATERARTTWRFGAAVAAATVLAAGIAVVQYLPSAQLAELSTRTALSYANASGGFVPSDFRAVFAPTGPITRSLTLGPVLLPLVLAGVLAGWKRGAGFWLAMLAVGWLLSLGGHGPLYPLFHQLVPGYALFRDQERAAILSAFATAVLAGYGADWFARPHRADTSAVFRGNGARPRHARLLAGTALAGTALLFATGVWLLQQPRLLSQPSPDGRALLVSAVLLGGAALLLLAARCTSALPAPLLAGCLAVLTWRSLAPLDWGGNLRSGEPKPYNAPELVSTINDGHVLGRLDNNGLVPADAGYVWRIPLINGMDELRPRVLVRLRAAVSPNRYWELMAVHWTLDWRANRQASSHGWLVPAGAMPVPGKRSLYLYKVPESRSLITLVHSVWNLPRGADAYPLLASNDFAPLSHALIDGTAPAVAAPSAPDQVRIVQHEPGRLVVQYSSDAPGVLIYSELDYPGWQVQLDQRAAPLRRADTLLLATAAPAGSHVITFTFRPAIIWWSAAVTTLAYVLSGWLLLSSGANGAFPLPVPLPLRRLTEHHRLAELRIATSPLPGQRDPGARLVGPQQAGQVAGTGDGVTVDGDEHTTLVVRDDPGSYPGRHCLAAAQGHRTPARRDFRALTCSAPDLPMGRA